VKAIKLAILFVTLLTFCCILRTSIQISFIPPNFLNQRPSTKIGECDLWTIVQGKHPHLSVKPSPITTY